LSDAPPLGLIEGYYGRPWTWAERTFVAQFLGARDYGFFIYAPKADAFLRRRWREPHPADQARSLADFAKVCAGAGVEFGVGLSPFEIYRDFDRAAQAALADKLAQLDDMGVGRLAILFDDMRGDIDALAASQARILHWIAERTAARSLALCPTYYSDDPALDRAFGVRPAAYLDELGAALDPSIDIFWTGPEVCSAELRCGHLQRVGEALRRKPLIWDNYPVNDGPRMSPFLHLRAFTGRSAAIGPVVAGHAINPALQPVLSCIPALTLVESYRSGEAYDYGAAFQRAAEETLGASLAREVGRRLSVFQDLGLVSLGEGAQRLRARFAAFDQPARSSPGWTAPGRSTPMRSTPHSAAVIRPGRTSTGSCLPQFDRCPQDGGAAAGRRSRACRHPFGLAPPDERELALVRGPFGIVFFPVLHDLVDAATVNAAGRFALDLYEMTKERGARTHLQVVDVAVQGPRQTKDELGHAAKPPPQGGQNSFG
jgi:hypothetical protein